MVRLEDVVDPAKQRVRLVPGYARGVDSVSIGGLTQPALWMQHVKVQDGSPVWVALIDRTDAPSLAVVIGNGGLASSPVEPLEGVVSAAATGSQRVSVDTAQGVVEAAFLESYIPQVSDRVRLLWQNGSPLILGKSVSLPEPPAAPDVTDDSRPVQPPPTSGGSGSEVFTAADSGTWSTRTGSWNSYFGKSVYQGNQSATGRNTGAWFYHGKLAKLVGSRVRSVRIFLPSRTRAGNYNSSVSVVFRLHGSSRKPGGVLDLGRSESVTVPKGFRGGWIDLPASWGDELIGGAGVAIAGTDYAGFAGVGGSGKDSRSGQLQITIGG